jgi:hypothetical protein
MASAHAFAHSTRLVVALALVTGCRSQLPDPQSAGAQIYQVRCSPCHRLFEPGLMTRAMWEMQVDRMQPLMVRRGVNPLTEQERYLIMSYLSSHASDASASNPTVTPRPR